ncbi:MAG TPA: amidase [Bryobacteraceae bacterium]|nr:amidase [Bryobacteraceae bacterium]
MNAPMDDVVFRSAAWMANAIRAKQISSEELVGASLERVEAVNPDLNAVIYPLAEAALAQARQADAAQARGESNGPLHGVPMTVKEAWETVDGPCTGGTLGRRNYRPTQDATVVARLKAAGAIPIGLTNTPEFSFAFESDNLVYGRTNNPYDLSRTPGGSGGGGAAIIAAGGAPFEPGADMGGSIRLPSHFSGIAGIKPTKGMVPMSGYFPPSWGIPGYLSAAGPMARYVEDLKLLLPIMAGPDGIDFCIAPAPLKDPKSVAMKGLRVAMHTDNGIMKASADTERVVRAAGKALEDAGAIVEEARPAGVEQSFNLFLGIMGADGGAGIRALLGMCGTEKAHSYLENTLVTLQTISSAELMHMLASLDAWRAGMLSIFRKYDLVLSPVNAYPAVAHGIAMLPDVLPAFSYTFAYNLTGWPGAVVRCGTSTEDLPIGVQALSAPWHDHVSLAAVEHLETALGGYRQPEMKPDAMIAVK